MEYFLWATFQIFSSFNTVTQVANFPQLTQHKLLLLWRHVCIVESGKLCHTTVWAPPACHSCLFYITCLQYVCTWLKQHLHRPRCLQKLQNEKKNKNNGQEGDQNVIYVLLFFASQIFYFTKFENGRIFAHVIMNLFYLDAISVSVFHSRPPKFKPAKKFATFY